MANSQSELKQDVYDVIDDTCVICQQILTIPVYIKAHCQCTVSIDLHCTRDYYRLNDQRQRDRHGPKCVICTTNLPVSGGYNKTISYVKAQANRLNELDRRYGNVTCKRCNAWTGKRVELDRVHQTECPNMYIRCFDCGFNGLRKNHKILCTECNFPFEHCTATHRVQCSICYRHYFSCRNDHINECSVCKKQIRICEKTKHEQYGCIGEKCKQCRMNLALHQIENCQGCQQNITICNHNSVAAHQKQCHGYLYARGEFILISELEESEPRCMKCGFLHLENEKTAHDAICLTLIDFKKQLN